MGVVEKKYDTFPSLLLQIRCDLVMADDGVERSPVDMFVAIALKLNEVVGLADFHRREKAVHAPFTGLEDWAGKAVGARRVDLQQFKEGAGRNLKVFLKKLIRLHGFLQT